MNTIDQNFTRAMPGLARVRTSYEWHISDHVLRMEK